MKKGNLIVLTFVLLASPLWAQQSTSVTEAFQRNYTRGSLSTKIQVLQDSVSYPDENMAPLYIQSLDFVSRNASQLMNDALSRELAALTVRLIGVSRVEEAALPLWELFRDYEEPSVQREVLSTLGEIAGGDERIIRALIQWVDGRNNLYRAGHEVDLSLLGEALTALGKLGAESAFPAIFTSAVMGYPDEVNRKAEEALRLVKGDYRRMVLSILEKNPLPEKNFGLNFVISEENISPAEKAWIARAALDIALKLIPEDQDEQDELLKLKRNAVSLLMETSPEEAVDQLIKHFDATLIAWERDFVPRSDLIQALDALGKTGSPKAAERLTLYIELLNLYTENGQTLDEEVVLSVIRNLGQLGDKIAFDYLLYVRYLNYSEKVKNAARQALDTLNRF